jgi:hypothetical protein
MTKNFFALLEKNCTTNKNFARLEKKLARLEKKIAGLKIIFNSFKNSFFSKIPKEGLNLPNSVKQKNSATHLAEIRFSVKSSRKALISKIQLNLKTILLIWQKFVLQ